MTHYQEVFVNIWPMNSNGEFECAVDSHFEGDGQDEDAKIMFDTLLELFDYLLDDHLTKIEQIHVVWQKRDDDDEDYIELIDEYSRTYAG